MAGGRARGASRDRKSKRGHTPRAGGEKGGEPTEGKAAVEEQESDDEDEGRVACAGMLEAVKAKKRDPRLLAALEEIVSDKRQAQRETQLAHIHVRLAPAKVERLERHTQRLADAVLLA